MTTLLADRQALADRAREAGVEPRQLPNLLGAADGWAGSPWEVVDRVELDNNEVVVHLDLSTFLEGRGEKLRHTIPAQIQRRGQEMRFVVESSGSQPARQPDPALIKAVARAQRWFEDLTRGHAASLHEIARAEGVSDGYVGHVLPLAFLSPEIISAILTGTQPVELTSQELIKRTDLPPLWSDQVALLGLP